MRTHHGAYEAENWQFDTDAETLAHYTTYATEHTRLFPYLRGLAEVAEQSGYPLIRHPAMHYNDTDWAAIDVWLLGEAMLVAPVLERGATSRTVALPEDVDWFDWWSGEPASAGTFDADISEIPVFVAAGSIVPVFTVVPDTLAQATAEGVTDLADADTERTLRIFGSGGAFTEADGTHYATSGTATSSATTSQTLNAGSLDVGGLTVTITGSVERSYTVEVYP